MYSKKEQLRRFLAIVYEWVNWSKKQIKQFREQGLPENHPDIVINKRLKKWYKTRIREIQIELEVACSKHQH